MSPQRLLTFFGLVAAGLLTLSMPPWVWCLAVLAITVRLQTELTALVATKGSWRIEPLTRIFGLLLVVATAVPALWLVHKGSAKWSAVHATVMNGQALVLCLGFIAVSGWLCLRRTSPAGIGDMAVNALSLLYAGWLPCVWVLLRLMPDGAWLLFWVAFAVGFSDTAALLIGRWRGKRPFFAHLSPKKTQEGAWGSLLLTPVVQAALGPVCGVPWPHALILGLLIAVSAQVGDLVESLMKRDAGLKDTAGILPGVGGLMDRFDSFLFAGPVAYIYLTLFVTR